MELPATTKDITVEWLNEVLHENGFLGDQSVASIETERIGIGKGFTSDLAKLHIKYDDNNHELPATMIAKLTSTYPSYRQVGLQYNLYGKEIHFYQEIAPESPIRVPKLFFAAMKPEEEKFVLIIEDCSRYEEADPELKGLNYDQIKIITKKLAAFHARWWDDKFLLSRDWIGNIHEPKWNDVDVYRMYWDICAKLEYFKDWLPKGGWEAGMDIYENRGWLIENAPDTNLTFCDVDYKADNMFFDWDTPDDPLIVIDWGICFLGRGAYDLSMVLGWSVDTELRRQIEKEMVKLYHDYLIIHGVSGYSFEECWEDYLKGLLQTTRMALSLMSRADENSTDREKELIRQVIYRRYSAVVDNNATSLFH